MAKVQYGFVDSGDVILQVPKKCDGSCDDAVAKVKEITKDAPEEMDTFSEVADKFKNIDEQIANLEEFSDIDLSVYVKKEELEDYVKRTEIPTPSDLVIKQELEEYVKRTEIPNVSDFVTKEEVESIIEEKFTPIEDETIDGLF